jgi:hypothetical protein
MKSFLIDIDGTVTNEDILNEDSHLYPLATVAIGSLDQVNRWFDEGNIITFFTSREEKDRKITIDWLDKNGFKYHGLIMNKPRFLKDCEGYVWVDNRKVQAVTYNGTWGPLIKKIKEIEVMD